MPEIRQHPTVIPAALRGMYADMPVASQWVAVSLMDYCETHMQGQPFSSVLHSADRTAGITCEDGGDAGWA
jgi:hypothetical protein